MIVIEFPVFEIKMFEQLIVENKFLKAALTNMNNKS